MKSGYQNQHSLLYAYLYDNNIKYLSTEQPSGFIQRSYLLRDKLIRQFESIGLEGSQLAIISAITLGEKGLLSDDVRDTFVIIHFLRVVYFKLHKRHHFAQIPVAVIISRLQFVRVRQGKILATVRHPF